MRMQKRAVKSMGALPRRRLVWVARASGLLVSTFCRNELFSWLDDCVLAVTVEIRRRRIWRPRLRGWRTTLPVSLQRMATRSRMGGHAL